MLCAQIAPQVKRHQTAVQHALHVFLARVKVKVGKLLAMTVVLDSIVAATTMRRAVYHVLQGKHQRLLVPRAKIAQLVKLLPVAKVADQGNIVATTIQLLHVWTVELVRTLLKQINLAA